MNRRVTLDELLDRVRNERVRNPFLGISSPQSSRSLVTQADALQAENQNILSDLNSMARSVSRLSSPSQPSRHRLSSSSSPVSFELPLSSSRDQEVEYVHRLEKEVKQLRDKVAQLRDKVRRLRAENEVLKAMVADNGRFQAGFY